jgi:predicted RNase H-like HicB family nuclease
MNTHYSIVIQWSDEDQTYIVSLPEWGDLVHTHGDTYQDALVNGQELLEGLIEARQQRGEPLPEPQIYASA